MELIIKTIEIKVYCYGRTILPHMSSTLQTCFGDQQSLYHQSNFTVTIFIVERKEMCPFSLLCKFGKWLMRT